MNEFSIESVFMAKGSKFLESRVNWYTLKAASIHIRNNIIKKLHERQD